MACLILIDLLSPVDRRQDVIIRSTLPNVSVFIVAGASVMLQLTTKDLAVSKEFYSTRNPKSSYCIVFMKKQTLLTYTNCCIDTA